MLSALHTPAAPLSAFVANLWSLSDAPVHARERIVPSGTFELVVNLREDEIRVYDTASSETFRRFSGAVVSGAHDRYFVIDTAAHACIIGVHFKPGGAFPFFGVPPGALGGGHTDLEALWGTAARDLREALCSCPSPARRFQILEAALLARLARLARSLRPHAAMPIALDALGRGSSVQDVIGQVRLSHRRFVEVFTAQVGMTPKLFGRVQRFQRAAAQLDPITAPDWAKLAAECGYFDQSHLIRDFAAFTGVRPTDFVRQSTSEVKDNHLPVVGGHGSDFSNTGSRPVAKLRLQR